MENISDNSELTAKKAIITLIKAIRFALSKEIYSPEESDIIIKSMKMFEPNLKNEGDYGWDKVPVDVQMNYMNQCDSFIQSDEKFNNFKRDTHYQKILEGGDHIVGTHAIDWLKNTGGYSPFLVSEPTPLEDIPNVTPCLSKLAAISPTQEITPSFK